MTRLKTIPLALAALLVALTVAACGEQKIQLAESNPDFSGAELFQQRCAGCHTFDAAGTQGSAPNVHTRERTDGPNFDTRHECVERVLYAIQNGGFSGAIMPANIVVGEQAQKVAEFVAKYAGREAGERPPGTGNAENGFRCTTANEPPTDDVQGGDAGNPTGDDRDDE